MTRTLASDAAKVWHHLAPWVTVATFFIALGALTALIERM